MKEKKKLTPEMINALKAPMPPQSIDPHPTKSFLSTIKAYYVVERINEVLGVGRWDVPHEIISTENDYVVMKGRIVSLDYDIVVPEQYGGHALAGKNTEPADGYKSAVTDILSKSASYLGVGAEVFKGEVKNGNNKSDESKPVCPDCKKSEFVIKAQYKIEKGKFLCWKKKDQEPTGCGTQFNTKSPESRDSEPPEDTNQTPLDDPGTTNGDKGRVTLMTTLNKLVKNKSLYDQIPESNKEKITKILISDTAENHPGIKPWIEYLTKQYASKDGATPGPDKKITTPQIKRLMAIANENGWSEDDVNDTLKAAFKITSKKDILAKEYDEIVDKFNEKKSPF